MACTGINSLHVYGTKSGFHNSDTQWHTKPGNLKSSLSLTQHLELKCVVTGCIHIDGEPAACNFRFEKRCCKITLLRQLWAEGFTETLVHGVTPQKIVALASESQYAEQLFSLRKCNECVYSHRQRQRFHFSYGTINSSTKLIIKSITNLLL
jgi:hypothetical protein